MTPISSAARPMRATRARDFVPEKLMAKAASKNASVMMSVDVLVTSMPNRLAAKPDPYSATAVIVTIIAQM